MALATTIARNNGEYLFISAFETKDWCKNFGMLLVVEDEEGY